MGVPVDTFLKNLTLDFNEILQRCISMNKDHGKRYLLCLLLYILKLALERQVNIESNKV